MKKRNKILALTSMLMVSSLAFIACNDNEDSSYNREMSTTNKVAPNTQSNNLINFFEVKFNQVRKGTWPWTYCNPQNEKTCVLFLSNGKKPSSDTIHVDFPRLSGVCLAIYPSSTPNCMNYVMNYTSASEEEKAIYEREIANGYIEISDTMIFDDPEVLESFSPDNKPIQLQRGRYAIRNLGNYTYSTQIPYEILRTE